MILRFFLAKREKRTKTKKRFLRDNERERTRSSWACFGLKCACKKLLAAGEKVRSEKSKIEIGINEKVGTNLAVFYAAKP